jgi:group I intron endonuclease
MNMVVIYKTTNVINGKSYIGFDSNWPSRKHNHLRESFNPNARSYHFILHKAIRKYGVDAFNWEVIYTSEDTLHTINVMESRFIQEHNSHYIYGDGYNMTLGGEGPIGVIRDHSFKQACSNRMMGNKMNLGIKRTPQQNMKNSIQRKGISTGPQHKISCPHCNKVGGNSMRRWHFENCKENDATFTF